MHTWWMESSSLFWDLDLLAWSAVYSEGNENYTKVIFFQISDCLISMGILKTSQIILFFRLWSSQTGLHRSWASFLVWFASCQNRLVKNFKSRYHHTVVVLKKKIFFLTLKVLRYMVGYFVFFRWPFLLFLYSIQYESTIGRIFLNKFYHSVTLKSFA